MILKESKKKGYERKKGRKEEGGSEKGRRERGRQKTKVKIRGWVGRRGEGRETQSML